MTDKKSVKKKTKTKKNLKPYIIALVVIVIAMLTGAGIKLNLDAQNINAIIEYAVEAIPAFIENEDGTTVIEDVPTVEEIDGGRFEDIKDGVSVTEGEYDDLGWSEYYDVSSPEAFKNATLGKCISANNIWGSQCVSLARVFWWSYADRDVSTCGTGVAKGMMNCSEQNAGDDFEVYWGYKGIQAGDWIIFDGPTTGHVGMALGPVVDGYVALLGENQGGTPCPGGGAATNVINISIKKVIGYYRPKAYIIPEPEPEPEPTPEAPDSGIVK